MRPHPRRARTNATAPEAWGTCDRSGFVANQRDLRWQYEYSGTQLINKRVLVAPDMLDIPNRQLGTIILPPDPVSIQNARPEPYPIDEVWPVMFEIQSLDNGTGNTGFSVGPSDAEPIYLEVSSNAASYPVPTTAQPTIGWSLETSSIPMLAATS